MAKTRKVSEPEVPDIEKCPRCGNNILIGDPACTRCGYDVESTRDKLRSQPANVVSGTSFLIGIFLTLISTGMENPLQFIFFSLGLVFVVGGGMYYAFDLWVINADDRRNKK